MYDSSNATHKVKDLKEHIESRIKAVENGEQDFVGIEHLTRPMEAGINQPITFDQFNRIVEVLMPLIDLYVANNCNQYNISPKIMVKNDID